MKAVAAVGMDDELWTVDDVSRFAKLSPSKIYRDAEGGLIPCRRWGRTGQGKKPVLRFVPAEVKAWLDAGCPIPLGAKLAHGGPQ